MLVITLLTASSDVGEEETKWSMRLSTITRTDWYLLLQGSNENKPIVNVEERQQG